MRAKADQRERRLVHLVDQDEVGPDVAIAIAFSRATERVIDVFGRQRAAIGEQRQDRDEDCVELRVAPLDRL
jgi:hypothetical protein